MPVNSSQLGYGCMSLSSNIYKTPEGFTDEEGLKILQYARKLGVTHFDTAIIYGNGHNEQLLGKFLAGLTKEERSKLYIATKAGFDRKRQCINGRPDYIREACIGSLERLGVDTIDLFYLHRIDTTTPIEESMGELKKLVEEGKIRGIGLSEASVKTIRRAHAVHPLTAVQLEWSLWVRDCEAEIIPTCRELGIKIVAYSPLGRGVLTGVIKSRNDLQEGDWRLGNPRFTEEAMTQHKKFVDKIEEIAKRKGSPWTAAKLSLAWVLAQGEDVIAIPGTANISHLEANVSVAKLGLELTADEVSELSATIPPEGVVGDRYSKGHPTHAENA